MQKDKISDLENTCIECVLKVFARMKSSLKLPPPKTNVMNDGSNASDSSELTISSMFLQDKIKVYQFNVGGGGNKNRQTRTDTSHLDL